MSGKHFQIAGPEVVHETVDDETIIVNLETGSYYDLNHSGACIFNVLVAGAGVDRAVAEVCTRYAIDRDAATRDLEQLLALLIAEQLIVPAPAQAESPADPAGGDAAHRAPAGSASAQLAYVPPTLGKYTDMQELLLLDPVHEVDELGWPRTA